MPVETAGTARAVKGDQRPEADGSPPLPPVARALFLFSASGLLLRELATHLAHVQLPELGHQLVEGRARQHARLFKEHLTEAASKMRAKRLQGPHQGAHQSSTTMPGCWRIVLNELDVMFWVAMSDAPRQSCGMRARRKGRRFAPARRKATMGRPWILS